MYWSQYSSSTAVVETMFRVFLPRDIEPTQCPRYNWTSLSPTSYLQHTIGIQRRNGGGCHEKPLSHTLLFAMHQAMPGDDLKRNFCSGSTLRQREISGLIYLIKWIHVTRIVNNTSNNLCRKWLSFHKNYSYCNAMQYSLNQMLTYSIEVFVVNSVSMSILHGYWLGSAIWDCLLKPQWTFFPL